MQIVKSSRCFLLAVERESKAPKYAFVESYMQKFKGLKVLLVNVVNIHRIKDVLLCKIFVSWFWIGCNSSTINNF